MRLYQTVLASLMSLVMASSAYAASKEVTLGTSVWPPYIMDKKSSLHGYAYDLVQQSFEEMGYKVTIKIMSWEKARQLTIDGKIDGLFPEYESEKNLKYFEYSDPFLAGPLVLYAKAGTSLSIPDTNNQSDFFKQMKGARFGVVGGYTNVPAFDNNNTLIKKPVVDDKANLEQLYNGDVDFILIDKLNAQYLLAHELPAKMNDALKPVGPILAQVHFYIVFSKKVPNVNQLDKDFNEGLQKIQATHEANTIMQQYISEFIDKDTTFKKED